MVRPDRSWPPTLARLHRPHNPIAPPDPAPFPVRPRPISCPTPPHFLSDPAPFPVRPRPIAPPDPAPFPVRWEGIVIDPVGATLGLVVLKVVTGGRNPTVELVLTALGGSLVGLWRRGC